MSNTRKRELIAMRNVAEDLVETLLQLKQIHNVLLGARERCNNPVDAGIVSIHALVAEKFISEIQLILDKYPNLK
jgi:hypothetical protein